jgi:hypothetical protein
MGFTRCCGALLTPDVTLVDIARRKIMQQRRVGTLHMGVAFLDDGRHALVPDAEADTLSVVRIPSLAVAGRIGVGEGRP